jgi:uncharacterized membrane protein YbhN (UPF0104 family)
MRKIASPRYLKALTVIAIIISTVVIFAVYIAQHPNVTDSLFSLNFVTILLLGVGYSMVTLINAWILFHSLRFVGKKVALIENILITGYSSIVNFFGPLQSGPGARAIYLKKRHGVKLRDFFVATIIFYGFFAAINLTILVCAVLIKIQSTNLYALIVLGFIVFIIVFRIIMNRIPRLKSAVAVIMSRFKDKDFWLIGLGAVALTIATAATYFVEIYHIDSTVSLTQTLIYTAAANLALFVSLTPGAIGIREAFLVLSQYLHDIETATIVSASVIDRAFYVAYLLVLFIALVAVNSRKHLLNFKQGKGSL